MHNMKPALKLQEIRYQTQMRLPGFGATGQFALHNASIACVGLGGLGSPACLYLSAAGVGTLGLIDGDRVDRSNLHRQILFNNNDVGRLKVEAARDRLLAQNPDTQIEAFSCDLAPSNATEFLSGFDLILDCTDNFGANYLINDAAAQLKKPVIYASVSQYEGRLAAFDSTQSACLRCLYPAPPKNLVLNCAQAGVLGPVVGTMGTLQANLALEFLLAQASGTSFNRLGRLFVFDLKTMAMSSFGVPKNSACTICSRPPEEIILRKSDEVSAEELATLLKQGGVGILDVREDWEFAEYHLPGSILWPLRQLENGEFPELDDSKTWIICCAHGVRSLRALELFQENSAKKKKALKHLRGGLSAFRSRVLD